MRTEKYLGEDFRKIQPKLRMVAKAKRGVNDVRSDFASALRIKGSAAAGRRVHRALVMGASLPPKPTGMRELASEFEVSVFVTRQDGDGTPTDFDRQSSDGSILTATMRLDQLGNIAEGKKATGKGEPYHEVNYVELGEPLRAPDAVVEDETASRPLLGERFHGTRTGNKVLVGIIDVGGFDFSHSDFLNSAGETRWVRIWDQVDGARNSPANFDYGREITQEHMNEALKASRRQNGPGAGLPAWALEPQSAMMPGSHGTHVASIAAGNRGVARDADLAGVSIALPSDLASDRRRSFYDSVRVAHAVDYLCDLAATEKYAAVSINISLGTNGGAHDASNAVSRWIDSAMAKPGRAVCVAAGNAGQEKATRPDDMGFVNGRIHTSGRIEARGLNSDIEWIVVGNGIADVSENELEIWYSGSDRFAVSVTPPGLDPLAFVEPRQYVQNQQLADGSFLSIYNELYHPANGLNYISIYLSPFLGDTNFVGVRPGTWKVRLRGLEVRDGSYHGWIERDDPRDRGAIGAREAWNFPSFFGKGSNIDNSSVNSLACGRHVVSVANLDAPNDVINISSSQGPTRDGRPKPDIAAPGTNIVAANGFGGPGDSDWVAMTGTSMASPYLTGVTALMLTAEPRLTAAQIKGILHRTAQPLPGQTFAWDNASGYGVVDADACLAEAQAISKREKLNQ